MTNPPPPGPRTKQQSRGGSWFISLGTPWKDLKYITVLTEPMGLHSCRWEFCHLQQTTLWSLLCLCLSPPFQGLFLCFVGLFCHTLSTFRSLYADHVPGWAYWEQQGLFGTNRWNEASWEHQRCPRTNHQTGSSLEKDSKSSNQLRIRNWALQAWLFHLAALWSWAESRKSSLCVFPHLERASWII